jgi:hypothetical protein
MNVYQTILLGIAFVTSATAQTISNALKTPTVRADTAPILIKQPTSKTVYEGSLTTFSVTAYGSDPLEYHWNIGSFEMMEETNSTYVIPAVSLADEADYTCIVSNAFGAVTSSVATLTVNTNVYPGVAGFVMVDCEADAPFFRAIVE